MAAVTPIIRVRDTSLKAFGKAVESARIEAGVSIARQTKALSLSTEDYQAIEAGELCPTTIVQKMLFSWRPKLMAYGDTLRTARAEQHVKDNAPHTSKPMPEKPTTPENHPGIWVPISNGGLSPYPSPERRIAFHRALAEARKASKLSTAEIAALIGVSASSIYYWERGQSTPLRESVAKLKQLFSDHLATFELSEFPEKLGPKRPQAAKPQPEPFNAVLKVIPPAVAAAAIEATKPPPASPPAVKSAALALARAIRSFDSFEEGEHFTVLDLLKAAEDAGLSFADLRALLTVEKV
jgi:transcriptional regulator with XRE-family HTH domain